MPFVLACLQAAAQMVPVESSTATLSPLLAVPSAAAGFSPPSTTSSGFSPATRGVKVPPPFRKLRESPHFGPFSTVALGLTGGTLGPGLEVATPLLRNVNLRTRGSYLDLQVPFTIDGVNYQAAMKLTSGQGLIDWFPRRGGFHVSVGALYLKTAVHAEASVAPGQRFTLGGTTYLNSVDDPVQGTATLGFQRRIAPLLLLGFGNLIPRSGRHVSVPFEFGGAYLAPPQINLDLAGTACTTQGCFNTASDPVVRSNIAKEQSQLNRSIRPLQVYPIVSLGLALRF